MIGEYRFFQEFFDGQIIKEDTDGYKMFKVLLFSFASVIGLFLVLAGFCNAAEFLLLELGMIWNFYTKHFITTIKFTLYFLQYWLFYYITHL